MATVSNAVINLVSTLTGYGASIFMDATGALNIMNRTNTSNVINIGTTTAGQAVNIGVVGSNVNILGTPKWNNQPFTNYNITQAAALSFNVTALNTTTWTHITGMTAQITKRFGGSYIEIVLWQFPCRNCCQ